MRDFARDLAAGPNSGETNLSALGRRDVKVDPAEISPESWSLSGSGSLPPIKFLDPRLDLWTYAEI